ncbi:MAG: type II toxin-antitoxin system PemK/MazF family toxin [Dehalococcoidia bacterium]|nr:type II toxin-antitoxin system PemK/MazF family toxin [Dehalococcoidia bacterium]
MSQSTSRAISRFPRYGDIWDANFNPVVGSEIAKQRPALIISNDLNNRFGDVVTILPLTGQSPDKLYPFEVIVPKGTAGLNIDSRILANQIRTIDKQRLIAFRGTLPAKYLPQVEKALKIHLNMK